MSRSGLRSSDSETEASNSTIKPLEPQLSRNSSKATSSNLRQSPKATLSSPYASQKSPPHPQPQSTSSPSPFPTSTPLARPSLRGFESSSVTSSTASPSTTCDQVIRDIIVRSFAPRVAVCASTDTEEFLKYKGFKDGLCGLVRPYGERLQGKVVIRDSIGGSKAWDDFGIRFVDFEQLQLPKARQSTLETSVSSTRGQVSGFSDEPDAHGSSPGPDLNTALDRVLNRYLSTKNEDANSTWGGYLDRGCRLAESSPNVSPLYYHYLRKLVSNAVLVPHETFCHPVTCLIAVSSHHPTPIEALRQLYASTGPGSDRVPTWMSTEYLRYYVLIHDEEHDDIVKSTALFDLMKRHFGLHCHLLRLRASQCVPSDDDSARIPSCEWRSAEEELNDIRPRASINDTEIAEAYIHESDAIAVRAFLREMVTQSIVPFMENRMMTWNDQVASRRRGLSGRFMSLSKRWAGFSSSKNATSGSAAATISSGSNYDHRQCFYPLETPEATMRQLGDYAFMLRDWKLAFSTYDFLRADFSHDKAWAYQAAANEMAAIASLLVPPHFNSKPRSDTVDQMLNNASYSYLARCSIPKNVVRCVTLTMELLQNRDYGALDDATRWGARLLEMNLLTPLERTLVSERLADCYASCKSVALPIPRGRKRQAALWNVLASGCWIRLDRWSHAQHRLQLASDLYFMNEQSATGSSFIITQPLWQKLDNAVKNRSLERPSALLDLGQGISSEQSFHQESEQLNSFPDSSQISYANTDGFTSQDITRPDATNLYDT